MDVQERRGAPRVDFRGVTIIESDRGQVPCRALNLSSSGMLLCPPSWLNRHAELRLRFALPAKGRWLDIGAQLVRRAQNGIVEAWAVSFHGLSAEDQIEIDQYVVDELRAAGRQTGPVIGAADEQSSPLAPEPALAMGEWEEATSGATLRGAYGSLDALALAAGELPKRWDDGMAEES